MNDYKQLLLEASTLRKDRNFEAALRAYRELWETHSNNFNDWDTWNYAKSAKECHSYDEAERIARYGCERWPDFNCIRQLLAWIYYHRFFKITADGASTTNDYLKAATEILGLCQKEPYSKYSPFVKTVFAVVKNLEQSECTKANAENRIKWLFRLDKDKLKNEKKSARTEKCRPSRYAGTSVLISSRPSHGQISPGKSSSTNRFLESKEYAEHSDLEIWYLKMSKALFEAEKFDKCIQLCEEALHQVCQLESSNNLWFRLRIAKSKAGLGCLKEAFAEITKIVRQKPDWYIYKDCASLAYDLEKYDEALQYSAEAALCSGQLSFKWKLFFLMAKILSKKKNPELAGQHAHLAARICDEERWPIKGEAKELFSLFKVDPGVGPASKDLERELKKQWEMWSTEKLPQCEGVIHMLHNEKLYGFIKVNGLDDLVYFKFCDFTGPKRYCEQGTQVRFYLKESYDKKKERASTQAVHVQPLGNRV